MKTIQLKPTIILENDNWFWTGTEEFLAQFGEFTKLNPSIKEAFFVNKDTREFCMMLSQPVVERIVAVSAFENTVPVETDDEGQDEFEMGMNQLAYYVQFIQEIQGFRSYLGYKPLEFHIVYNGIDFLEDLHKGKFGMKCLQDLYRFAYQQPEIFKVNIYKEYELLYSLNEENLTPRK